ncbi:hypothetical protein ACHAWF_002226 [Thalassiosira exigua]
MTASAHDNAIDLTARLDAMKVQESASQVNNYFERASDDVDESCRASMVQWTRQISTALELRSETVWMATSFLDRYLSSGKGKSQEALEDRHRFQLAHIACFYLAVKIREPAELTVSDLADLLCRGYYDEADVVEAELDVLFALDWRLSVPTPMEYVARFLEFLPNLDVSARDYILEASRKYVDRAAEDFYFATKKPSVVGAGCLVGALTEIDALTRRERQAFWITLGQMTNLIGIMYVQKRLLGGNSEEKVVVEKAAPKADERISTKSVSKAAPSRRVARRHSPVCISQTPRRA